MSFFGTGGRGPANQGMPADMMRNMNSRPGPQANRTPKYAYYDPEMAAPRHAEEAFHPAVGAQEGDCSGQGHSFGQGTSSQEGTSFDYRETHGIEFGSGFEERKEAQKQANAAKNSPQTLQKQEQRTAAGLTASMARNGIVLSEILGPPKGRAYFNRRFG